MSCEQFQESYELYALGSLEAVEANAVAEHLAGGCERCHAALRQAIEQNELVSQNVPLLEPPARLRRRLKASIVPDAVPRWRFWPWAVALAALLLLAAGIRLENRLRQSDRELARASQVLNIVQAPGTKQVAFNDAKTPSLHGSLFIHQKLGMALIIDSLPDAPAGWVYESWLVPKEGAPQAVEPFQASKGGRAVTLVSGPVDVGRFSAMAVSMEPSNSHPTKPTTMLFSAAI